MARRWRRSSRFTITAKAYFSLVQRKTCPICDFIQWLIENILVPRCGLVAMMMALKLVKPELELSLDQVLLQVKTLNFSKFGEMFSGVLWFFVTNYLQLTLIWFSREYVRPDQ